MGRAAEGKLGCRQGRGQNGTHGTQPGKSATHPEEGAPGTRRATPRPRPAWPHPLSGSRPLVPPLPYFAPPLILARKRKPFRPFRAGSRPGLCEPGHPACGALGGSGGPPPGAMSRNLRTALIFGGFVSLIGAAFYPIYFRPLMRLEEYRE